MQSCFGPTVFMINIACVYKDQKYSEDWVDRLYRGVERNITVDFNFHCISNRQTKYNTIPLQLDSDGYWNKVELFRKDQFDGPVLYFDLDVVICNDITPMIKSCTDSKLYMAEEPYRSIHNSSVMLWNQDYSNLYDNYVSNQADVVKEYQDITRQGALGDQAYISENIEHNIIDHKYISWEHHKMKTNYVDPTVLIFTGSKKPNLNQHLDVVKDNWI